ncbi:MAG: UDP-N-acetylmuramoyl-tripeptide--D-alanyl-D-alanine ligase, partial [Pseudomonadota bacterium]
LHARLGETLADCGIDRLFTLGDLSKHTAAAFGKQGEAFQSVEKLNAALLKDLHNAVTVLVKGSRGMRMERVVEAIAAQDSAGQEN